MQKGPVYAICLNVTTIKNDLVICYVLLEKFIKLKIYIFLLISIKEYEENKMRNIYVSYYF